MINHLNELIPDGRFITPLPRIEHVELLGESRYQALRRFRQLEQSLHNKDKCEEVDKVVQEYFDMGHAEEVPEIDLHKEVTSMYYLPIHVVYKASLPIECLK